MFLDASQRSENPTGAAAGWQETVRKGGGETDTSHPHQGSNGLLGPHLFVGPQAESSHCKGIDSLGLEGRAFEVKKVAKHLRFTKC